MSHKGSACNVLEFLFASTVMGCVLALLIPVTFKVYEVSENVRYAKQLKEIDARHSHGQAKNNNL